jgi:CRISPR-associated endonuclease/helicase Cas3
MGEAWCKHAQQIAGDSGANRTVAQLHVLEIDKEFASDPNMAFPIDQKVGSRLGAEDRLIQFEQTISGPFGQPIRQLPVRAHLLPKGLPVDAVPSRIETCDGVTIFTLGETRFRYSRLGLERLKNE